MFSRDKEKDQWHKTSYSNTNLFKANFKRYDLEKKIILYFVHNFEKYED